MADIKGYFKIITLNKLNEKEQTGYDLIQALKEVLDRRPSAGSIYPLLNDFFKKGYVTIREEGRKKIYSITKEGKNTLKKALQEKEQLVIKSAEILKLSGSLSGKKELKSVNKLIEQIKSKSELILKNIDIWIDIKDTMLKLVAQKDYKQKQKRVRKVLQETRKKLKGLQKED